MKRFILLIMVLTVGWGWAGAQSDNNEAEYVVKSNNYQDRMDKATRKAYNKMQKAKAKYKKELSKYKKEMSEYGKSMSNRMKKDAERNKERAFEFFSSKELEQQADRISEMMGDKFSKYFNMADSTMSENNMDTITRKFEIANFTSIKCSGIAQLIYTHGDKFDVKAEGPKLFVDNLDIKVNNGILNIETKNHGGMNIFGKYIRQIRVYVSAPSIKNVSLGGCTSFSADEVNGDLFCITTSGINKVDCSKIKSNEFECTASGASKINLLFNGKRATINNTGASEFVMNVDCEQLDVNNSGAGTMKISGNADKTDIHSSGVAKVDITELNKY